MYTETKKEEYAVVLDFLLSGKSFSGKSEPIAQLVGEEFFTLLEAIPKQNVILKTGERVYIGKNERDKIALIKQRIGYNDLTQTAKSELPNIIMQIVKSEEQRFVNIFNTAGPLNIREHSLSLLPGIGKKHLDTILKQRSEKKFESFKDILERCELVQDPAKMVAERIIKELQGNERFYLFVKPLIKREQ